MTRLEASTVNSRKKGQLVRALETDLAKALQRGFFGEVRIKVNVQDGTIQDILHQVERIGK